MYYIDVGDHDKAIETCETQCGGRDMWITLAWRIIHRNDYRGALRICGRVADCIPPAIAINDHMTLPSSKCIILDRIATVLIIHGNNTEAIKMWKRMIEVHPCSSAYNSLASIYRAIGDYDRAIRLLQESIDIDSHASNAWRELCICHSERRHYPLAIIAAQKDVDLRPTIAACRRLTDICVPMKDVPGANKAWEKAVDLDPSEWVLETLPKPFTGEKNPDMMHFAELLQWEHDDSPVWDALAKEFYAMGHYDHAIRPSVSAIQRSVRGCYEYSGWTCLLNAMMALPAVENLIILLTHETVKNKI
jgi:tetratricopeptide (TPR) repeat protein